MASLELKPAETAVAVRVADGGELAMLVQTGFRMGPAQLSAEGRLGTILLFPTQQPPGLSPIQNSFMVNTVRATAAEQSHVVELSPTFDVVAVVLHARAPEVRVGTGESEALAPFALVETRLAPSGQISELFVRVIR